MTITSNQVGFFCLLDSRSLPFKEFRRHREVTNPLHVMGFLSQWKVYLDGLPRDSAEPFKGKRLDQTVFEKVVFAP